MATPPGYRFCFDAHCGSLLVAAEGEGEGDEGWKPKEPPFFVAGAKLINSTERLEDDLPDDACRSILRTDRVQHGWEECSSWCQGAFGPRPWWEILAPVCGTLPIPPPTKTINGTEVVVFASESVQAVRAANKLCAKVQMAKLTRLQWGLHSAWQQWSLATLYVGVGLLSAGVLPCLPRGGRTTHPQDEGTSEGPSSRVSQGEQFQHLDLPLCCCPSPSDRQRAGWQLLFGVPGVLLDNPMDVLTAIALAAACQPYYCIATVAGIAMAGWKDPYQTRAYRAAWETCRRGFPTLSYLEHQAHEGGVEAPIGGFIAVLAVLTAEPDALGMRMTLQLLASAFTSLALAMPGAAGASFLLQLKNMEVINDYAKQEQAKKKLPQGLRNGPAARLLGAVALVVACSWGPRDISVLILVVLLFIKIVLVPFTKTVFPTEVNPSSTGRPPLVLEAFLGVFLVGALPGIVKRWAVVARCATRVQDDQSRWAEMEDAAVAALQLLVFYAGCAAYVWGNFVQHPVLQAIEEGRYLGLEVEDRLESATVMSKVFWFFPLDLPRSPA